jgi:hypothetical protein
MVRNPHCLVSECWEEDEWVMDFRRSLTVQEYNSWIDLTNSLQRCIPESDAADIVSWALEPKGLFSTKSLYRFLTDWGMPSRVVGLIWKCKMPLKIKFFLWQMFHNKLQVAGTLVKRGWRGNMSCCLCDCVETVNHLLFKCHLAKLVWSMLQNIFELDFCPRSLEDLSIIWLQGKGPLPNRLVMFFFAGFTWALWTTRNKMAIEKSFVKASTDVIYVAVSLLQRWSILLKEKDKERVSQALEAILRWLKNFKPKTTTTTDVFEI